MRVRLFVDGVVFHREDGQQGEVTFSEPWFANIPEPMRKVISQEVTDLLNAVLGRPPMERE